MNEQKLADWLNKCVGTAANEANRNLTIKRFKKDILIKRYGFSEYRADLVIQNAMDGGLQHAN